MDPEKMTNLDMKREIPQIERKLSLEKLLCQITQTESTPTFRTTNGFGDCSTQHNRKGMKI